jgi:hypothetical protein
MPSPSTRNAAAGQPPALAIQRVPMILSTALPKDKAGCGAGIITRQGFSANRSFPVSNLQHVA